MPSRPTPVPHDVIAHIISALANGRPLPPDANAEAKSGKISMTNLTATKRGLLALIFNQVKIAKVSLGCHKEGHV